MRGVLGGQWGERCSYPDEDEGAGVAHFVFALGDLDHGELGGAGAAAQDLPHLWHSGEGSVGCGPPAIGVRGGLPADTHPPAG